MFEPKQDWNRAKLDGPAREAFVRKAKADRFAWEAAELLAKGTMPTPARSPCKESP